MTNTKNETAETKKSAPVAKVRVDMINASIWKNTRRQRHVLQRHLREPLPGLGRQVEVRPQLHRQRPAGAGEGRRHGPQQDHRAAQRRDGVTTGRRPARVAALTFL